MASGRAHDRATWQLALPFGLVFAPALGLAGVVSAATGFLVGGLLLSPDLDTRSNATRRWGPLRMLWWPYRHGLAHRSVLSHSPLLGTAGRLAYMAALALLASALLATLPLGVPTPPELLAAALELWQRQRPLLLSALVGLEASSWLHLIQDGDPLPRLPRPWRRLRPRSRTRSPARRRR
ncbi:metal-binding protein [Cyanobium sp. ATX 6A2]|uniref:metal-binding protein n=1 Tax=Cyanobium sp. ATX 6A2 TaxID=2823700 RepID=UPI0020CD1E51|nr:metal-binding protein [Cyanobium sp. ATX 6A2]MCP9887635.1 metal-binding protein [Cyanobium sp. ATX 6A2]